MHSLVKHWQHGLISFVFKFLLLIEMITGCTHPKYVYVYVYTKYLWFSGPSCKCPIQSIVEEIIENKNKRSKDPMHFWSIFWSSCRKLGLTWSMLSVRYNVNSLTSCPVEWSKSMSRDTKRINQTIRCTSKTKTTINVQNIFFHL